MLLKSRLRNEKREIENRRIVVGFLFPRTLTRICVAVVPLFFSGFVVDNDVVVDVELESVVGGLPWLVMVVVVVDDDDVDVLPSSLAIILSLFSPATIPLLFSLTPTTTTNERTNGSTATPD